MKRMFMAIPKETVPYHIWALLSPPDFLRCEASTTLVAPLFRPVGEN